MRSAFGFLSLLAFGFLAAGILAVAGSGPGAMPGFSAVTPEGILDGGIHLSSLLIGMVFGVVLSALARVSWAELPRRFVGWLVINERNFYRLVLAGIFVGVLLYY